MAALLVIGIVILLIVLVGSTATDIDNEASALWSLPFMIGLMMVLYGMDKASYKNGQIDALNGKYEYKQHVIYYDNDTIPKDTIYVRISNEG